MLNLSSVLLQACQPFTDGIKDEKVCLFCFFNAIFTVSPILLHFYFCHFSIFLLI
jgi:hypothetical protein